MSEEQAIYWVDTIEVCTTIIAGEMAVQSGKSIY